MTLSIAEGFRISVPAMGRSCFHEMLSVNSKLGINYQVEEGGNYDVDFIVCINE